MIDKSKTLKIEFIYTTVANFAIQQNRIPIVRKLIIENISDNDFSDLEIVISSMPEFSNDWKHRIEILPKEQSFEIEVKGLNLSSSFLSELTEKLAGELLLSVLSNGVEIFSEIYSVEVLAYDQWNGSGILPEMLSAFVTPNHPEISKVLHNASIILEKWTGNPSFDAYQSLSVDRVKKQLGAIYEAIANLEIVYCSPPASFEKFGQRIRMCDTMFSQKLATCVDISILYASCIEAVGLNPLLIIINGHAFVGAWLINETFADSINYDVSLLKKRTAQGINEIVLVEATCMNAGMMQAFDESINRANYRLVNEEEFILFVDVKRSRFSGIKPLPQRVKTVSGWKIIEEEVTEIRENLIPENIIDVGTTKLSENNQFTKQKLWERKLLDLSLRNNLLNLRTTQSTIQLLSINLNTFEDALANGDEFQVLAKPVEWVNPNIKSGVYQTMNMSDPIVDLLKYDLAHKRLRTYLTESELKSGLIKLYRSSRLSLEENGANTLYLALGFLKWYESPQSELARYAPILLLPIEIIRKSAQIGYVIRSREEDTIMNITLLEMLKQDFGITIKGLDELPRDASGVDVVKIFNIIRRAIMSQSRWDLEEHAFIGIFSFSKFIMWNDLNKNAEKLKESKVVASLISGKLEWNDRGIDTEIELDGKYHPSEIALPISADSTQLEAICAAAEDTSFILHGPPGTGKSQTITNIIANALYKGKKVLFVAEKMAALSVVQKRLTDIGLDPFCLELHSNKSKKSSILEQLQKTTEVLRKSSPQEFASEAERLKNQKTELNEYVKALHKKHSFGFSLFDSFAEVANIKNANDNIQFENNFIEELTKDKFIELSDIVEELQNAGRLCGHPYNHPLKEISTTAYTQQIKVSSLETIRSYVGLLSEKISSIKGFCDLVEINEPVLNKEKTGALKKVVELLISLPDTPGKLVKIDYPDRNLANIIQLAKHGIIRDSYREELLNTFVINILDYKSEIKLGEWKVASKKWAVPKYLSQRRIIKSLQSLSKGIKISNAVVENHLEKIILYQTEQKHVASSPSSKDLDFLWNDGNAEWKTIIQICETILQIHHVLLSLTNDVLKVKEIKNRLADLLSEGNNTFLNGKGKILLTLIENENKQKELEIELTNSLKIDFTYEQDTLVNWTEVWKQRADKWLKNLESLKDWTTWTRIKQIAINAGLLPLVNAYEGGILKNEEVLLSFKKSLYRLFADYIISNDPALSIFNGKMFDGKINKFKKQSKYFEELTKAELFAKLASKIPSFTSEASNNSEIGILQKTIRSGGRGISIRRLFDSIPNLLPRMCPCMLMSPISVAQYFEVDKSKFDLIIFDEASQMPTCEAIGAIARGENVIVVGDPKQMPPTNFFSTNRFDEDNADKEDLESILDDCLALSMPSKHLLWHYRSKHESLIAFSNSNFYDNKLMTFPSPDDISTKVTNVFVQGFYDRGKTRVNIFEAKAIIEEVKKRLLDPELSKRSIGIVTFSSVQQNLIEDLLNEEYKNNPELEKIAIESYEPIFIKNLENVQGDERDVILFSVGYGPDKEGKVYLSFGPIIRKGGWRRLNVAISRARYEMKVFSTLRSDQIDISRSASEEILGFKAFLAYTEKGIRALPKKSNVKKTNPKYFEKKVAEEIEKLGYQVHTNIGCSGFRIDIGIVNPHKQSEYILGVLTDGENYNSSKTAGDREVVQPNVLKMLGWNIYKLWSPDWWDNSQKIIRDIDDTIIRLLNNTDNIKDHQDRIETISIENAREAELTNMGTQGITQFVIQKAQDYIIYESCVLENNILNNSDEFFAPNMETKLKHQIQKVMEIEAPISHELLSRKILNAWGISRLGVRLNDYLSSIYHQLKFSKTKQNGSYFYWRSNQDPNNYEIFRIAGQDDQKRNVEDIAKEEIVNGIKEVLATQISLPKEDLIREVARLFGYNRIGTNVEEAMKLGINCALKNKAIINQNGRFVVKQIWF